MDSEWNDDTIPVSVERVSLFFSSLFLILSVLNPPILSPSHIGMDIHGEIREEFSF